MSKLVRASNNETDDWKLTIAAYAHRIEAEGYPLIVVEALLEHYPNEHEFWPPWVKLKPLLDAERVMLRGLCRQLLNPNRRER